MKKEDLLFSLGELDDSVIADAKPRGRGKRAIVYRSIAAVASLAIVVGVVLSLIVVSGGGENNIAGNPNNGSNISPDSGIGSGEDFDSRYGAGEDYKRLISIIENFDESENSLASRNNLAEDVNDDVGNSGSSSGGGSNGSYITISQNQVENVEEPDTVKMTDKYIFRIGGLQGAGQALRIYSLEGKNSKLVCEYPIPYFDGSKYSVGAKMFLSPDGNTVTIIKDYQSYDPLADSAYKTAIVLLDVSNVTAPKEKEHVLLNGRCAFARMYDGRLVLGTSFLTTRVGFDWSDPQIYLPYYEIGQVRTYLSPEDIICPDEIYKRGYINFALLDENLDIMSIKAVFGLSGITYISEDKIIVSMAYGRKFSESIDGDVSCKSDMAILDYSSDSFETEGIITVNGWVEDRFFIDEHEGHLRLVTNEYKYRNKYSLISDNSSLYVYDLSSLSLVASVVDFAPDGEQATSVRFDGDRLYVCTAEIVNYLDPVFFFDLSDYSNITEVNTGFIDGFSSTLISFGDGYLLGIGPKDSATNKVSVYKRQGDAVITVAEYYFKGGFSTDRKSFLIDAERGLFGFATGNYRDDNGENVEGPYILLHFDGESFIELLKFANTHNITSLRSVYFDGYLYLLKNTDIEVRKVVNFE